jgi:hypothetical protein
VVFALPTVAIDLLTLLVPSDAVTVLPLAVKVTVLVAVLFEAVTYPAL